MGRPSCGRGGLALAPVMVGLLTLSSQSLSRRPSASVPGAALRAQAPAPAQLLELKSGVFLMVPVSPRLWSFWIHKASL